MLSSDAVMPEKGGHGMAAKIIETHPVLRCLFMSGCTASAIARHGILDKGILIINKPFTIRELSASVRAVLRQAGKYK